MPNQVQVDFVGNSKPLYATADAAPAKLAQSGDAAGRAFANAYSNQTAAAFARQDALERDRAYKNSVAKLAAYRKDKENEVFIEQQTADKIARIRGAGSQRANAAGRLNLARQGADVFTQLGSGQGLGIIAIQQGPQILDAAAQSGFKLAGAMQSVAAFAAAYGATIGVAGAGLAVIYKITNDIANAEAQKLKFIEDGAKASNKAILAKLAEMKAYNDAIAAQEHQFQFSKQLEGADANRLKQLLQIAELTGRTDDALKIRQKQLELGSKNNFDSVRAEYRQKRDFEDQLRQIEKEGQQKRLEDAQKRIEKTKELNKVTFEFFQSINQRTNADNPFFKILSDAQELEKQILKLNPAFQALARSQASLSVANSLFGAKIDNALGVSDLKSQAAFFRNGQKGESADDLLKRLGINPAQLQGFSDAQKTNLAAQIGSNQAFQFGRAGANGTLGGVNVADLAIGAFQNSQQRQSSEETAQQRLDRQFRELDKLTAANDPQRQAIDRRIASLSQGIDPTTLRQDTRNRIADSIERNAEALARQQGDATKALQDNTAILNKLNANLERQIGVIQGGGNQNSLEVTVKPSAGIDIGVTPIPASPNQAQTNELYASDGLGFAGG